MVTFYKFPMLALIFGASVLNMAEGLKCTVEVQDITWNFVPGRDTSRYGIPTVQDCKALCLEDSDCKGMISLYNLLCLTIT